MNVLVNAFGISSAGGITVLKKTMNEFLDNQENQYYIFVFSNQNILNLVQEFNNIDNIHFKIYNDYGILFRLLRENLYFLSEGKKCLHHFRHMLENQMYVREYWANLIDFDGF